MSFAVDAEAYDRFLGRYSTRLAPVFADFARVVGEVRAVDVGCGPGALTAELVRRVGADHVAAADPSEPFVAAARERFPGVDVQLAPAESLPFEDGAFDAALAQLVVHFMTDPVAGVGEMARVTRSGGTVAACVWDIAGESPLTPFWRAVRLFEPDAPDETERVGTREGELADVLGRAGLRGVVSDVISVRVEHERFDDWWQPFLLGVGPAGQKVASLDEGAREALRERCREQLGDGPFSIPSRAWAARGTVV